MFIEIATKRRVIDGTTGPACCSRLVGVAGASGWYDRKVRRVPIFRAATLGYPPKLMIRRGIATGEAVPDMLFDDDCSRQCLVAGRSQDIIIDLRVNPGGRGHSEPISCSTARARGKMRTWLVGWNVNAGNDGSAAMPRNPIAELQPNL